MIKNNLSRILGERRMKMSELIELTGLGRSTVERVYYHKGRNISYDTLDRICNALEISVGELLEHSPD
ncbi:MAG: hypothetical protein A2Y25_07575 [Candidatus Melainabacteria bacterium GWF2_37_15]|nr:MAG: hypothetical protein A2Y25_07575 [Candidatus Melainabacteria bacterium GWF2_37_15]